MLEWKLYAASTIKPGESGGDASTSSKCSNIRIQESISVTSSSSTTSFSKTVTALNTHTWPSCLVPCWGLHLHRSERVPLAHTSSCLENMTAASLPSWLIRSLSVHTLTFGDLSIDFRWGSRTRGRQRLMLSCPLCARRLVLVHEQPQGSKEHLLQLCQGQGSVPLRVHAWAQNRQTAGSADLLHLRQTQQIKQQKRKLVFANIRKVFVMTSDDQDPCPCWDVFFVLDWRSLMWHKRH